MSGDLPPFSARTAMIIAPTSNPDDLAPALPRAFRASPVFSVLNVAAVGLSLGAIVSLPASCDPPPDALALAAALGLPTVLVGMIWARGLRSRLAGGWLSSLLLAWLNSTLIGGAAPLLDCVLGRASPRNFPLGWITGALIGATLGALVWIPALLATLLLFGVPIALARRLARRGFSGAERGEVIVGAASAVVGSFAHVFATSKALSLVSASAIFTSALGLAGAAAGGVAIALALEREARRRRFVIRVEAGEIPGYRIGDTSEGRGLFRVPHDHAYRARDELVAILTKEGAVTRVVVQGQTQRPRRFKVPSRAARC
jgi:hypothetical protein